METKLAIERVSLDSLHPDPANTRAHGERNLKAIQASLQQWGQAEPLVIQASTRKVIGGNGRLVAMRELGWTHCDVVVLDVDDLQATGLSIALNRTAELATWDEPGLARILEELQSEDALVGVGFLDAEIDDLLVRLAEDAEIEQDQAPELPDKATTKPGNLWILGRHRLLCGDSSSWDDVAGSREDLGGVTAEQLESTLESYS